MATYNTSDTWYVNVWRYGSADEPSFECSHYKHYIDCLEDITDGKDAIYECTLIRKTGLEPVEMVDLEAEAHKVQIEWQREHMQRYALRG